MFASPYRSLALTAIAVIGAILLCETRELQAQTRIWVGAAGADWNTAANWGGDVPNSAGETGQFSGSGVGGTATATFGGNTVALGSILTTSAQTSPVTINSSVAGLNFRMFTGGAGIVLNAGAPAFSLGNAGAGFRLIPDGGGTLTFQNDSGSTATLGSAITNVSGGGGAGFTLAFTGSGNWHSGAAITPLSGGTPVGSIIVTKAGGGTLTLAGTSTYAGGTTVSAGTLRLTNTAGAGTGLVQLGGGTLSLFRSAATTTYGFSGITSQAATSSVLTVDGVGANQGNGSNAIYVTGPITVNGTLTVSRPTGGDGATQFDSVLAGSGTLIVDNTNGGVAPLTSTSRGRLFFSNTANTFNGSVQVLNGGNFLNNTLNPTYASVDVASGGYITIVADASARNTTVGALTGAGNIIRNTQSGTATLIVGNGNADGDFSGVIDQTAFLGGAGAIALTKVGSGTQILSGSSNHTGATLISGGSLMLGDGGAGGSLSPSSTITNNGNFTVFQSDTVTQGTDFSSSSITGTGSLTARGTGTLVLNTANAYGGGTSIGANIAGQRVGVIRATASGALGSGTVNLGPGGNDTTARLELSGGGVTLNNPIALAGRGSSSTNNTVAIQNLGGSNTLSGTITIGTGGTNYRIQSDAGLLTLSNATAITSAAGGTRVVTLQGAGNGVVSGAITQTGGTVVALVKEGAGAWTLSAANTYDGGTTINDGRVVIGGPSGLLGANTAANAVVINANGTLEFGRAGGAWLHSITGAGNVDVSASIVTYSGDLSGFNGNVNILAGGRFALGANNSGSAGAAWKVDGILSLSGNRTIALGELSGSGQIFTGGGVNTPNNTFVVGGLNTDSTFAGTIGFPSNSGINLTKTGTGILTLSGNNTYNGTTNINDGTLLVNGLHTGGGAYTVASAGTLGGSGNISGPAVSLSGTVSPGDGVGTLSADNFNWQNGGVYDWEIASVSGTAGVAWDLLDLSGGTLAFVGGGPYEVDIDATAASFTAQNYLFEIARASSISAFNAANFTLDVDGAEMYQWSIRQQGNSLFLQAVALPEPSTWILFAVGGVTLGLATCLRRARVKITN